jgi:hypothetical protein
MEGAIILIFIGIIYFIPSINASKRGHKNMSSIVALNILLGWSGLGWIAAFIWSLSDNVEV